MDRGRSVVECERGEPLKPTTEEDISSDHQAAESKFMQGREGRFEFAFDARLEHMELKPERAGRRPYLVRHGLGDSGIARIDKQSHAGRCWDHLVQQLQLLRSDLHA